MIRKVSKRGVKVNGVWFTSPILASYIGSFIEIDIPEEATEIPVVFGKIEKLDVELHPSDNIGDLNLFCHEHNNYDEVTQQCRRMRISGPGIHSLTIEVRFLQILTALESSDAHLREWAQSKLNDGSLPSCIIGRDRRIAGKLRTAEQLGVHVLLPCPQSGKVVSVSVETARNWLEQYPERRPVPILGSYPGVD